MRESCLSLKEKTELRQELFHSVRKLDVLQELIEDETITEIMVNGPDKIFYRTERTAGEMEQKFYIKREAGRCDPADRGQMQQG